MAVLVERVPFVWSCCLPDSESFPLASAPIDSRGGERVRRSIMVVLKDPVPFHQGDQRFESSSLQRRVSLTGVFGGSRRKSPAFAESVSLDVTRERDVLARSRLVLAPFSDGH